MKFIYDDLGNLIVCSNDACNLTCTVLSMLDKTKHSTIRLPHRIRTFDITVTKDTDGCVLLGMDLGWYYVAMCDGIIVQDSLRSLNVLTSPWRYIHYVSGSKRFILCGTDNLYATDPMHSADDSVTVGKSKLSLNSDVGPQNKLLLWKDKSILCGIHNISVTGTVIILLSRSKLCL